MTKLNQLLKRRIAEKDDNPVLQFDEVYDLQDKLNALKECITDEI